MTLTIRHQIVALFGALRVGAMADYLNVTDSMYGSDKVASIYDLNSLLAETLSEEVRAGLTSLVDKMQYFAAEQTGAEDVADNPDRRARAIFSTDSDVLSLEIYQRKGDGWARSYRYVDEDRL